jgi:4-amino-4-deoxy-L-arabinose transferase-like glycosyltransferase
VSTSSRIHTVARVAPVLIAVGAFALRASLGPLTVDDAYITFRYARHLADGVGLVYNPGELVLGTTTPLYTLLMAFVARVGFDLPHAATLVNALCDAATVYVLFLTGRRLAGPGAGLLAAALFALTPMSIAFASAGMETSLFCMLLVIGCWLAIAGRTTLAALALGIATLTRPEALILGGLLVILTTLQRRRPALAEAAVYAAPIVPWVLIAIWYFGSPLPQSMAAKAVAYRVDPFINPLAIAMHTILPGESLLVINTPLALVALLVAPLVVITLWAGARRILGSGGLAPLWVLVPLIYDAAYVAVGLRGVRMFPWYVIPTSPFLILMLAIGGGILAKRHLRQRGRLTWLPAALLIIWWLPGLLIGSRPGYPAGYTVARESHYRELAADYADRWGPTTLVAAPEIGALGYFSEARILDTVGLVSPAAARYYPLPVAMLAASDNAVAPRLIEDSTPDYVVSLDQFVISSLDPDPWFQANYRLVERRVVHIFTSDTLLVYQRIGSGTGS